MIQVGDVLANEYETYLVKALNKERTHAILKCVSDDSIPEESYPIASLDTKGSAFMECDLGNTYNQVSFLANDWFTEYEQQKQRADELEKRWSELVDVLKKKYEYYKVRADDESFGSIEQGKWKIAKHELMMVLKIMTDLKRGETE